MNKQNTLHLTVIGFVSQLFYHYPIDEIKPLSHTEDEQYITGYVNTLTHPTPLKILQILTQHDPYSSAITDTIYQLVGCRSITQPVVDFVYEYYDELQLIMETFNLSPMTIGREFSYDKPFYDIYMLAQAFHAQLPHKSYEDVMMACAKIYTLIQHHRFNPLRFQITLRSIHDTAPTTLEPYVFTTHQNNTQCQFHIGIPEDLYNPYTILLCDDCVDNTQQQHHVINAMGDQALTLPYSTDIHKHVTSHYYPKANYTCHMCSDTPTHVETTDITYLNDVLQYNA